jgi:hypothetical protein
MNSFDFEYRKLGSFTYHLLNSPADIKSLLMHWIMQEWQADHHEAPAEMWTVEWMNLLPQMEFSLQQVDLLEIQPRTDLMNHAAEDGPFIDSLNKRADEREEAMLRGVSIEPLLVNAQNMELMDGYTRHTVLKRHKQEIVYIYAGLIK